jgi:hypothetical protein
MSQKLSEQPLLACVYSLVKAVPHPLREETVNIGVIVLAADGSYSEARFAGWGRVRRLARDADVRSMEHFLNGVSALLPMHGRQGHMLGAGQAKLNADLLNEWSRTFGGSIRVTAPRGALTANPHELCLSLYRDFVDVKGLSPAVDEAKPITRRDLLSQLDKATATWNIHEAAIAANVPIHGQRAQHYVDRAFLREQNRLAAVVHALSFEAPELSEIYAQRATIIVAAEDLHDASETAALPVFALYTPANHDRLAAVQESAELFRSRQVTPVRITELRRIQDAAEARLALN